MNRFERKLKAIDKKMAEEVEAYKKIWAKADEEDREPTEDERLQVESHLKTLETLKEEKTEAEQSSQTLKDVAGLMPGIPGDEKGMEISSFENVHVPPQQKSAGELFVESKGYKDVQEQLASGNPGQFSTGAVALQAKGTLLEGATSGLALATPVPQVVPGVVEKLFQRLTVADLLASGQATTSSLRYVVEGTATSGAAGVAEGGTKPESTLGTNTVDEPIKKIATTLSVSDEMLEDAAQVQSYINGRLSLFISIEEERQLLLGTGTNDLVGITQRSGVNTYARGTADNNAVAIFKAMNGTRGSALLEPDAIVMHPTNWQTTRLLTDTAGQFFGGGPFYGPYGGPQGPAQNSGQLTGNYDALWGKTVVVTSAMTVGSALLGSFGGGGAQLFRRGGISVEASNSHASYFTANLVAVRAEERLGLAVYRPPAFTIVTGLS